MTAPDRILRVLVVDDSAYVRKVVREMLSRSPFLEVVGHARNGVEALQLVEELRPDVVTCDLVMPEMDGETFVRTQMARRPVAVVVISSVGQSENRVLGALDAGAVDFVQKPTALALERMFDMGTELIAKVKAAGVAVVDRLAPDGAGLAGPVRVAPSVAASAVDVVVIGVSTGGPQALRRVVPLIPVDVPVPIVVGIHMPAGYTASYASRLHDLSKVAVREAVDGDRLEAGQVLLAPGGLHLSLRRTAAGAVVVALDNHARQTPHRPSIDLLFRSAADVYGQRVLAVVMTGMGSDGQQGAAWIKARGGAVITEAEETCVVYGMPRAVVEAGLSDRSYPLDHMANAILEHI